MELAADAGPQFEDAGERDLRSIPGLVACTGSRPGRPPGWLWLRGGRWGLSLSRPDRLVVVLDEAERVALGVNEPRGE